MYILIILVILVILIKWKLRLKIKWRTLLKKGFRPKRQDFGLYTYTGNQGKGKTYSLIEYLFDNKDKCVFFGNIKNINIKGLSYVYYDGFNGLVKTKQDLDSGLYDEFINNKQVVFIFDELFTELQKTSRLSLQVQDFLCQLRKRKIIFLTTAQVWAEVPLYFRRLCRYQIDCNMFPFFSSGLIVKKFNDAENMKWDNDLQEHVAPTLELSIAKVRKVVSQCYDTRERIVNNSVDSSKSTE